MYFSKILVDYFIDRYIITDNEQTIIEDINIWNAYRPKIWHRLIHDIYHFFANKGLLHYNNKNDTYHLGERDGKFASLNGEVSEWIYNLLCEFYEKKDNKTSARFDIYNGRKDKIDAIKNFMEADVESLMPPNVPKEYKHLFL